MALSLDQINEFAQQYVQSWNRSPGVLFRFGGFRQSRHTIDSHAEIGLFKDGVLLDEETAWLYGFDALTSGSDEGMLLKVEGSLLQAVHTLYERVDKNGVALPGIHEILGETAASLNHQITMQSSQEKAQELQALMDAAPDLDAGFASKSPQPPSAHPPSRDVLDFPKGRKVGWD